MTVPTTQCKLSRIGSYPIDSLSSIRFAPDGSLLAGLNGTKLVTFRMQEGIPGNKTTYELPSSLAAQDFAFSPDSSYIVVNAKKNKSTVSQLVVFTLSDEKTSMGTVYPSPFSVYPGTIAFSPQGTFFVTTGFLENVNLFTFANGVVLNAIIVSLSVPITSQPFQFAFSPNGSHLAIANLGGDNLLPFSIIILYSVENGMLNMVSSYFNHKASIGIFLDFSPDGSYLAAASDEMPGFPAHGINMFKIYNGTLVHEGGYGLHMIDIDLTFFNRGLCIASVDMFIKNLTTFSFDKGVLDNQITYNPCKKPKYEQFVRLIAVSPDREHIALACPDSIIIFKVDNSSLKVLD